MAGVLTNACLCAFLVLFLVFFFLFGDTAGFCYTLVAFWLLKQKFLPENLNCSTDVDIDLSGDPGPCLEPLGVTVIWGLMW